MQEDDRRHKIESLFRRYGKGVASYVLARVGDAHAAESITANVFLLVVRRFDQCRSAPPAWMWAIVRSELARHFRDRREVGSAQPLDAEPLDASADPALLAERGESDARMRRALARLSDEQQTVISMKFFLEMPNVAIAEALQLTPTHVGVVVHRAVKRLRELMGEEPTARPATRRSAEPADIAWSPIPFRS